MKKLFLLLVCSFIANSAVAQQAHTGRVAEHIAELVGQREVFRTVELFQRSEDSVLERSLVGPVVREATFFTLDNEAMSGLLNRDDEHIRLSLPMASGTVRLLLERVNIFSDGFSVVTGSSGIAVTSENGRHYRGIIEGDAHSLVSISVFPNEVMGVISDAEGNHNLGKIDGGHGAHIYYAEDRLVDPPALTCSTLDDAGPQEHTSDDLFGDRSTKCVDLYWEVNYDIFTGKGGLVNTTTYVTGLFNQHATLYANDGITVSLSQLFIWDVVSPYTSTSSSGLLNEFRNYRNSVNGDLAHLLGYGGGGGIAAGFAGLCASNVDNSMCYSGIQSTYNPVPTYSWSAMVVTHEEGHLLGSRHTHACVWNGNSTAIDGCGPAAGYGYEGTCSGAPIPSTGGTIMSYCHLNAVGINFNLGFGPQPAALILNNVENAACLTTCAPCVSPAGLTVSAITMTSAQCMWQPVTPALPYRVQWRISGTTQWNTLPDQATTTALITGLAPDTDHNVRVGAVCNASWIQYGPVTTFRTHQCTGAAACDDSDACTTDACTAGSCTHVPLPDADGDGVCDAIDPCPLAAGVAPGQPCDDGDGGTDNDVINGNCVCVGTAFESVVQIAKIVASDRAFEDYFGSSVSISGDFAIVGAYREDQDASGGSTLSLAGAAYIFHRSGTSWVQTQKIVASDRSVSAYFGSSVSISGDYAIVGAYNDGNDATGGNFINGAGSAYVFQLSGSTWTQMQKVVAADRDTADFFGTGVSISGDYAIIAAASQDHDASGGNALSNAGAAYIFRRSGSSWVQEQKIVASDRSADDRFGNGVSLDGDLAIVGAPNEDHNALGGITMTSSGSAYIFRRLGTTWVQEQKIVASDRAAADNFGSDVSISGDRAIIGAPFEDHDASGGGLMSNSGSAYIFHRSGTTWSQAQKIVASDRAAGEYFGNKVSISGDYAVVGATDDGEDAVGGNALSDAGSAYVIKRSGTTWSQAWKIVAGDRAASDRFGNAVAINGTYLIVGAQVEDEDVNGNNTWSAAGSAYLFSVTQNVHLSVQLWLEGPYSISNLLMNDNLRVAGSLPAVEPYTTFGYPNAAGGGAELAPSALFTVTGNNAIVDWVRIELRAAGNPQQLIAARHALLQRDGDVVNASDGVSPVILNMPAGSYYVAVRHRNHLGCMTNTAIAINGTTTTIDFRSTTTAVYGTEARKQIGNAMLLWSGNTDPTMVSPRQVQYAGAGNDRDPILVRVGSTTPNNTVSGYYTEDCTLDGVVKYVGAGNDRDPILINVGSTTPNNVRVEQLP